MKTIRRLLLVSGDDTAALLDAIGSATDARADVVVASSLDAALQALQAEAFDVALLDLDLPQAPGLRGLALLRSTAPELPVLVLADPGNELGALKAVAGGADDYLLKGQIFPTLLGRALRYVIERRRAVHRLEHNERYFRALIENGLDVILLLDDRRRVRYASPSLGTLLGGPADDVLGVDVARLVHPADRGVLRDSLRGGGAVRGVRIRVRTRGMGYRTIEANARDLRSDPAIQGVVVNCRDVTARIEMEEAVSSSERYFRALIENASDLIGILEPDGRVRYLSPSARRLLGFRPERLLGHPLADLLHPDDRDLAAELLAGILADDAARRGKAELRFQHHDGDWRTFEVTLENRLDDPVIGAVVVNARDATDSKAAQAELGASQDQLRQFQKLEAIGRLAGGVAHDFNNLLTAMSGHIYLLSEDIAEEDPRRLNVEEIKRSATRAADLTRQLLAFSRKQVLRPTTLDLNAVVVDIEKMLGRLIGEDIELSVKQGRDLGQVRADLSQIEQVLMNLAVNARDAMPSGGRLTIETANASLDEAHPRRYHYVPPGQYVLLAVTDTGVGMDEAVRLRIFEPFFTTKEVGKGTGLGLSTVYGVVKQSNGFIWVDSEVGVGTRFEVYLPRVDATEETVVRTHHPPPAALAQGVETILLVEDEEAVRSLASRVLRRSGYNVLVARHGRHALAISRRYPAVIDLLVTDLVMPQIGGRDLADALARRDPPPRVLLISGYTPDALPDGVRVGGYPYLQKPFTPDVLTRRVREVLDDDRE